MKQFKLNLKLPIFRSIALLFLLLVLQAFYFPFQKCGRKVKDNGNNEKDMPDKEGKGVKGIKLAHLHKAAGEGDVEEVRRILEKINTSTEEDKENFLNSVLVDTTALGKAIKNGFEPIVRLLIQQPQVDINETGKELPSLLLALKCNQPEIAKVLLTECGDKKLNVTDKDPKSWQTPLHIASRNDPSQVVIVNLLLQRSDTDVNALDKNNETPLHLAARNRSKSAIQLLLQHPDIKANLKNNKDQTPLDLARPKNARDQYCFELIRDFIDQKKTGNKGDGMPSISNPEVLDNGIMSYLKRNKFSDKSMQNCFDKGLDVNARDPNNKYNWNLLMHLTANKNASGVKCLINRGADVNAQDDEEDTALHLASRRGAVDIVNQLLNAKGINVNLKNKDKKTALDEARKDSNDYYHVKIIKLLEDSGAKSGKAVS